MEVIVGKMSGFCEGVNYTVKKAYESLKESKKVYCLGEIVHNERVIEELSKNGMIFVNNLNEIEDGSTVIIRAHGESKDVYEEIKRRGVKLLDLTCGKIRVIRNKIEKQNEDSYIVMIGKKNHPETKGTISFCNDGMIFENEDDLKVLSNDIEATNKNKIYILSQTTFSGELFYKFANLIKESFEKYDVTIDNTICSATHERQEETRRLAQTADLVLIVGGKKSSNTKELYDIAKENCKSAFLIQEASDLDLLFQNDKPLYDFIKDSNFKKIDIMAGASTNNDTINEIVNKLKFE